MHEPDGYSEANDMVIAQAQRAMAACSRSRGSTRTTTRFPKLERALERGARGIKLHPRAEQFALDHPALAPVFELADERRLPVWSTPAVGSPRWGATRWRSRAAIPGCA